MLTSIRPLASALRDWLTAVSVLIVTLIVSPTQGQTTWYVDDDRSAANGCTSWADACPDLQAALGLAGAGDQIWVALGTYKPAEPEGDRTVSFELANGAILYGGFDGTESKLEDRAGLFDMTVLSGDLNGDDAPNQSDCCVEHAGAGCDEASCQAAVCAIDPGCCDSSWSGACAFFASNLCVGVCGGLSDNSCHVLTQTERYATAVVDGFTITAGNANHGSSPTNSGGGIWAVGSLQMTNLVIVANFAMDNGGGVHSSGSLAVNKCAFVRNRAYSGGAMYTTGSAIIADCGFEDNRASSNGGALACPNGTSVNVSNCVMSRNCAGQTGGGMIIGGCAADVRGCIFSSNSAFAAAGVYVGYTSESQTITDCIFESNMASSTGGGLINDGFGIITTCLFNANSAGSNGGGASLSLGGSMTNCLFATNSAGNGGGLFADSFFGFTKTVTNCTISANTAVIGGGIYSGSGTLQIGNCVLWENTDSEGAGEFAQVHLREGGISINHTCLQGLSGALGGVGNIGANPLFIDGVMNNYHLSPGSPCIDGGANSLVSSDAPDLDGDDDTAELLPLDLDGNPRFFDDLVSPDTGSGKPPIVDMGAYEFQGTCKEAMDCDDGLFCDGFETLCESGICQPGIAPCRGGFCSEAIDACVDCLEPIPITVRRLGM